MSTGILAEAAKIGGVKNVVIIDDAYDPPKPSEISENAFNLFVQSLEDSPSVAVELKKLTGLKNADLDDWNEFLSKEKIIYALWKYSIGAGRAWEITQSAKNALTKLFDDINLDRSGKLAELKPLEDMITESEVKLKRLGSDADPKAIAKADIVFLDFYLSDEIPHEMKHGEPQPSRGSFDRAREKAIECIKNVRRIPGIVSPAFILISSHGSDPKAERFRISAGQMKSRFRFVSKGKYSQPHELLAIADIFRTCRICSIVEPLQKAWDKISLETSEWIRERLFDLDISDFGYLYKYSLEAEGQPVPDYVKELISAAVAEHICCEYSNINLPKYKENPFKSVTHYFESPTNGFAELYFISKISNDKGYRGKSNSDPQSGDIFLVGRMPSGGLSGKKVISIMSPTCDLVDHGSGPRAKSVLLIEGTLQPITFKKEDEPHIIKIGNVFYEIAWERKCPAALKITDIRRKWKRNEIKWLGRLKGEHFLALQASYLLDLGRIGLLKPPAAYVALAGEVVAMDGNDTRKLGLSFTGRSNYAYLLSGQSKSFEKQEVVFSGKFIQKFVRSLDDVPVGLSEQINRKILGIKDRMELLVQKLIEKATANGHGISNYLTIELCKSKDIPIKTRENGIIVIRLWPD